MYQETAKYSITSWLSLSPVLYIVNAIVLRVPAEGVSRSSSRSSSRSPPGVAYLPMDSGSEYCRFESHEGHRVKNLFSLFGI